MAEQVESFGETRGDALRLPQQLTPLRKEEKARRWCFPTLTGEANPAMEGRTERQEGGMELVQPITRGNLEGASPVAMNETKTRCTTVDKYNARDSEGSAVLRKLTSPRGIES